MAPCPPVDGLSNEKIVFQDTINKKDIKSTLSWPAQDSEMNAAVDKAVHPKLEYEDLPTSFGKMVGLIYALSIVFMALGFGFFVFVPAILILPWVCPSMTQRVFRVLLGHFCAYVSGVFEFLFGMEVVITGEHGENFEFKDTDRILLISNHRTEIDWLLHWYDLYAPISIYDVVCRNFAMKINRHDRIMTMLKADLKNVPLIGYYEAS
jgi:hypothetical protein